MHVGLQSSPAGITPWPERPRCTDFADAQTSLSSVLGYALRMTYSIVARDPHTREMGVATQSQAFAVGSSVSWAMPGAGVIATQSIGEPMYGELGLDLMRSGLTAPEALDALRSIDPSPERRQVAMVDCCGALAAIRAIPASRRQDTAWVPTAWRLETCLRIAPFGLVWSRCSRTPPAAWRYAWWRH